MSEGLIQEVQQLAARLKRQRAKELAQDPAGFRREAVRAFRASLSPGPGRPRTPNVTLAEKLRDKGKPWQEIYPLCITNYAGLNVDSQRVEAENLRSAVRSRRNARRRRKPLLNSSANKPA
jgi:hypothetical protein